MELYRKLTPYEQFLESPDEANRFNFCIALEYTDPPYAKNNFVYSLDLLQRKHSILRSSLLKTKGKDVFFATSREPIPFSLLIADQQTTWQTLVSEEIHRPFDHFRGPLLRVVQIKNPTSMTCHILVTFDHLIADGISGVNFVIELLKLLELHRTMFPDFQNDAYFQRDKNIYDREKLKTGVLHAKLDQLTTERVLESAQKQHCSVQAVLLAAQLAALRENIVETGMLLEHESAVNLRRYSVEKEMKSLFGVIRGSHNIDDYQNIWSLSKDISGFLEDKLASNLLEKVHFSSQKLMQQQHMSSSGSNRVRINPPLDSAASDVSSQRDTTKSAVSNLGRIVDPFKQQNGVKKVKNFYVFLAIHGRFHSGQCFNLMVNTFQDELHCTFSYPIAQIGVETAKTIFNKILNILSNI